MNDYVKVIYDDKRTPKTKYPLQFAFYLFKRFRFKKGDSFLEIGCGRGEFLESFHRLGLKCSGVDLSDFSVKNLKHFNVKKVNISKDKLPFKDNSLDVVYHKSLIEHLYNPDHLMKETYRVLKPGGVVIILTPDWVSQMKVFYEDYTHSRPYDRTSLGDVMKIHNFSKVKTELFCQLPILWKFPLLKIFSKLLRIFISTPTARALTQFTKIKFIRWSVELMVLGYGIKTGYEEK